MREVDASEFYLGKVTESEYYSATGELLLSKGITINERHLDILRRRNIFEVYVKDEETELNKMLQADFGKLDELALHDAPAHQPLALTLLPELRSVTSGEEGLKQLLAGTTCSEMDRALRAGRTSDRPIGPALKVRMRQMAPDERGEQYKKQVHLTYVDAIEEVRALLNRLADAEKVSAGSMRAVVERFMQTFITDHNILLNLACIKHDKGDYLYHHTLNVCLLSINIAAASGYSEEQVVQIGTGALLHDIGMFLVPREIRFKKGRLDADEWFEVQKHPVLGLHILERISHLPEAVPYVAYQIHERENGKGYPKQRTGRFIHCYAKVVQTADIFEAMSSPRTYRQAYAPYKGIEMLVKMTRQGLLDGEFVKAFLMYASLFPVGSIVELSDRRLAKVVAANGSSFTKPRVSILSDPEGKLLKREATYMLDLNNEIDLQVVRALPFNYLNGIGLMDGF